MKRALQTLTYLHTFTGYPADGSSPYGALINVNGTLYGTTFGGGYPEAGTVYSVTASGSYAPLYSFQGDPDGAQPYAGLANLNGTLYGTTSYGGSSNGGAVYSMTTGGAENVIQNFYAGSFGQNPSAGLLVAGTKLYGTASSGGVYNTGAAFSITTSGVETVLHSFGGPGDGTKPTSPLIAIGSNLYGTTQTGGSNNQGTVYEIAKASGHETVLHSFGGYYDGGDPLYGRLVNVNGTLYGTTRGGGTTGSGTIYSISPTSSGSYAAVYSFQGGPDGCNPVAGLVAYNGLLYGTASRCGTYGRGTIFAFDPTSNALTPIWAFGGSPGGATPAADLIVVHGTFYGTTNAGGPFNDGTVFSFVSN
ncbi:MAG TPA: choice-of-anchor tandem repeat GloVer-containing protein [Candidatus Cybelea sp.]|nr:choice-of-anchor tandem repeat GloVer-containing protein [Candidatus Cybelea sp.]